MSQAEGLVAPHFTVGQLVSKQGRGFPTYLVLRERLLLNPFVHVDVRGHPARWGP